METELQTKVISATDLILSPNAEMQKYFADNFKKHSYCLPHCYDDADISGTASLTKAVSGNINLIYGGAFYAGIEENISLIKQFIDILSDSKTVRADFYVSIKGFEKELAHPSIKRSDYIDSEEYFGRVKNADLAILILPPNRVNAMSSKFYELVALRKPILYFGLEGSVSEFLIKHRLGFHITRQNMKEQAQSVVSNMSGPQVPDLKYNIESHTFSHQTKLLIDTLLKL